MGCCGGRIPFANREALQTINIEWTRIIDLLPSEGEVSEIDAATVVQEQWERSREAYSGAGVYPTIGSGEDDE